MWHRGLLKCLQVLSDSKLFLLNLFNLWNIFSFYVAILFSYSIHIRHFPYLFILSKTNEERIQNYRWYKRYRGHKKEQIEKPPVQISISLLTSCFSATLSPGSSHWLSLLIALLCLSIHISVFYPHIFVKVLRVKVCLAHSFSLCSTFILQRQRRQDPDQNVVSKYLLHFKIPVHFECWRYLHDPGIP